MHRKGNMRINPPRPARGFRPVPGFLTPLALAACSVGGNGGQGSATDYVSVDHAPTGTPVKLALVDSPAPALPAQSGDTCVVYTLRPTADQAWNYTVAPVPDIFAWIGGSIRMCMAGTAQAASGNVPASFYQATLYIDLNGSCPAGDGACYYPLNPTVDQAQTHWSSDAAAADWQLDNAVGHEVWHAVAGNFHP
jgi:hypothetical protein